MAIPLHAGFAAAASVQQSLVNEVIAVAEAFLNPLALPASINVGSQTITIVGTFAIGGISVTLKQSNGNLVQTNVRFSVNATLSDGRTSASYGLNFNTIVMVGLSAFPSGKQIILGLDLSNAKVTAVTVQAVTGGNPTPAFSAAITSPAVLGLLTSFLQSIPPKATQVTPGLLPSSFDLNMTYQPPGGSIFSPRTLFDVTNTVRRIVWRQFDSALTVAIDLEGLTTGDPNQLIDLTRAWAPGIYEQVLYPDHAQFIAQVGYYRTKSTVALVMNGGTIGAIVGQISAQVSGKFPLSPTQGGSNLVENIQINNFSASFGGILPPLGTWLDGISANATVTYWTNPGRDSQGYMIPGGTSITCQGSALADLVYYTRGGPTSWVSQGTSGWGVNVLSADISLPFWVSAAVAISGLALSIASYGFLAPVMMVGVIAALDGIIPGILANVENQAQIGLQSAISLAPVNQSGIPMELVITSDGVVVFMKGLGNNLATSLFGEFSAPAPALATFKYTPGSAQGYQNPPNAPEGTLMLSQGAPAGGLVAGITSSERLLALPEPDLITIPEGALTPSEKFYLQVNPVSEDTPVTLTANIDGSTLPFTFTILAGGPPNIVVKSLRINPSTVIGGAIAFGQFTLVAPAGPGGGTINVMSSDTTVATVPATVSVGAGAGSGSFAIHTKALQQPTHIKQCTIKVVGNNPPLAYALLTVTS